MAGPIPVAVDVATLPPDIATVDILARIQLWAQSRGYRIELAQAGPELRQLIALMGLSDALPVHAGADADPTLIRHSPPSRGARGGEVSFRDTSPPRGR